MEPPRRSEHALVDKRIAQLQVEHAQQFGDTEESRPAPSNRIHAQIVHRDLRAPREKHVGRPNRHYVFTINNPTGLLDEEDLASHGVRYCIYSEETAPTTGTHHFQGYVEFTSPKRFSGVHKIPGFESANLSVRRGTRAQAIAYCEDASKEGFIQGPYQYGDRASGGQGARNDYATFKTLADGGASEKMIWDEVPDLYLRFHNVIPKIRMLLNAQRNFKTLVYAHWGLTGAGKSSYVRKKSPSAYWKQRNEWWDGYDGTSDVVLDDFYGWLPYDTLLRLCDAYPCSVGVKGSTVGFAPQRIFITSNLHPQLWYSKLHPSRFAALERRITRWYEWTAVNTYTKTSVAPLRVNAPPPGAHIQ